MMHQPLNDGESRFWGRYLLFLILSMLAFLKWTSTQINLEEEEEEE